MRIAQFVSSVLTPLGGAEQYCLELSRWLRDRGHDVTVVTGWGLSLSDVMAKERSTPRGCASWAAFEVLGIFHHLSLQ